MTGLAPAARFGRCLLALLIAAFVAFDAPMGSLRSATAQEVTSAQRRELRRIDGLVDDAVKAAEAGRWPQAGQKVTEAIAALDPITAAPTPGLIAAAKPIFEKLAGVHGRLVLQEIEVPSIAGLAALYDANAGEPMEGGVSFEKEIAPLLAGKCGNCHVSEGRGDFRMTNYNELMVGTAGGRVVLAGNGVGSRIVQVIEEGDMPRGGGRVTDEELALLRKWIDEGARAAVAVRETNLSVLAADSGEGAMPTGPVPLRLASGSETVSFSLDVAPIVIENCSGCHLEAQNVQGGLNLQTFDGWLRGGDTGVMLVPGTPDESLLIQKLRGTAGGDRMPRNRPPLSDETIAKIAKWIEEGATYDAQAGNQDILVVAAQAKAAKSTHDELLKERSDLASDNWRLGLPSIERQSVESDNFLVVGNVDRPILEELSTRAEKLAPTIVRFFRGNARQPFVKGRMTIFAFAGRYDYSEFGTMVEKRDLPANWSSHWRYDVIDSYAAFIPPRSGIDDDYEGVMVQQLASGYVAALGRNVPRWFADGTGYLAVVKLHRNDPRVKQWEAAIPAAVAAMEKPDDFIAGRLPDEQSGLVALAMVTRLSADTRRWQQLMQALHKGEDFQQAFQLIWGATPTEIVGGDYENAAPSGSGRRRR